MTVRDWIFAKRVSNEWFVLSICALDRVRLLISSKTKWLNPENYQVLLLESMDGKTNLQSLNESMHAYKKSLFLTLI